MTGTTRWPPRPQHRCVGVLFGGPSAEHEVSCSSALAVLRALPCDRFQPVAIGIDREGGFVLVDDDEVERLRQRACARAIDDRLTVDGRPVRLQARPGTQRAEVVSADGRGEPLAALDAVFPLLHGSFGEDGVIQGLLEALFVPYVGCGVLASAVGMDKVAMKRAFLAERIPITPHVWFDEPRWVAPRGGVRLVERLQWPLFVKPANMGSSIGVSRVSSEEDLHVAVEQALRWDDVVLVEQAVRGRELECGVLGGAEPEASVVGEVSVTGGWFDYQQKYFSVADPMIVPAPLDAAVAGEIRERLGSGPGRLSVRRGGRQGVCQRAQHHAGLHRQLDVPKGLGGGRRPLRRSRPAAYRAGVRAPSPRPPTTGRRRGDAMTGGATTIHREWLTGRVGDWVNWRSRVTFPSQAQVLKLAVQLARPVPGHIIEFGVWKGIFNPCDPRRTVAIRPMGACPAPKMNLRLRLVRGPAHIIRAPDRRYLRHPGTEAQGRPHR